jgi:hypothetical protein
MKPKKETLEIKSLAQLQKLVDTPVELEFELHGQPVKVLLSPVTPSLAETIHKLQRASQPPWVEGRKEYNLTDQKYLAEKVENIKKARSLTVYGCCPAIAQAKPGLVNVEDVHKFIQGILSETILDLIEAKALVGGLGNVQGRANFTSTLGSDR